MFSTSVCHKRHRVFGTETEATADQVSLIILSRLQSGEDWNKAEEIRNLTPASGNWEQRGDKRRRLETAVRSRSQLMCWTLA